MERLPCAAAALGPSLRRGATRDQPARPRTIYERTKMMRRFKNFALATALTLLGCIAPQNPSPPVFGGQGANVSAGKEAPLPADKTPPKPSGPCAAPAPPGDV